MLLLASYSGGPRRRGLLSRLWSIITWPFRAVDRAEKALGKTFRRRRERFRHKYRHSRFFAPLVGTLVWLIIAPLRLVWMVITAPFRLVGGAQSQLAGVRKKRELVHLVQGIPAALAAIGGFTVLMMLALQETDLPREYRQRAQTAFDQGDYERARLYLQRVLQLGADTNETSYLLALTLERGGNPQRATAIYNSLAPDDGQGFPEAHLRRAGMLYNDPETRTSEAKLRSMFRHLKVAEQKLGDDPDLLYYMGQFYLSAGELQSALNYLERASQKRPDVNYELAILYLRSERPVQAKEKLNLAVPHFRNQLRARPTDTESRLKLADLHVFNEDYEATFQILQEGISLIPDGPFRGKLAKAYVHRYDTLPRGTDPSVRLELLSRALEFDPRSASAFNRLLYFGDGGSPEPAARKAAEDMLEHLIAEGTSAPLAHFALGIKAWNQADSQNAIWHLERAYKLDPSLANLANNLAWALAFDDDAPDCGRALSLINSVLEQRPEVPAYIETRGQILARLGRWNEALDDLERALPTYHDNIQLHETLAEVYSNLEQPGLADKHAIIARNLKARQAEK